MGFITGARGAGLQGDLCLGRAGNDGREEEAAAAATASPSGIRRRTLPNGRDHPLAVEPSACPHRNPQSIPFSLGSRRKSANGSSGAATNGRRPAGGLAMNQIPTTANRRRRGERDT